jgi:hypothetical protein
MKTKKIITIIVTVIASAMVVLSGVMKLMMSEQVVTTLSKVGVANYIIPLGLMEILFTVLFLIPRTMKIGFLLLSCYFAGALATELSHGTPLNAITPLTLVWLAAFLRDKHFFLPKAQEKLAQNPT